MTIEWKDNFVVVDNPYLILYQVIRYKQSIVTVQVNCNGKKVINDYIFDFFICSEMIQSLMNNDSNW